MKTWHILVAMAFVLAVGAGAARAECEYEKTPAKTSSLTAPAQSSAFA
ncbi:MAG: hypothetical protein U1E70_26920 [Acetobacteraceae bacterium]|nr:hypothetical protein [Pseudomonadota bacterium]